MSSCQGLGAGYKLESGEAERLLDQVDVGHTGHVAKGQLAASQIDWAALQRDRERWLARVRRAFDEFDADHDGVCGWDEIVACLRAKLPLTEVCRQPYCSWSSISFPAAHA
jgi:calcium-dependent protein kinase